MKKQKIWALVLSCALLFTIITPCVYAETTGNFTVQGSMESVQAGKQVTVNVDLVNNPGISAINLWYEYNDTYFTLAKVENKIPEFTMTHDMTTVWDAVNNCVGDRTLVTLTFDVADNTPAGEYPIGINFISASNDNFEEVTAKTGAATIKVETGVSVQTFLGGSLRMDYNDYTQTSLRFGYRIDLPEGAKLQSWYWDYSVNGQPELIGRLTGHNMIEHADGSITSNLVITGIPQKYYERVLYAQLTITYILNGETVTITENTVQKRSVAEVANAILEDAAAKATEKTYAQGIVDTLKGE